MLKINIEHSMLTHEGVKKLRIDTELARGELLCLYGHSGAGKTTLLRIIAGLIRPESGRISFDDELWFDADKRIFLSPQERNTGFMFQDYALFPHLSVEKNITYAQKIKDNTELESLMEIFGLSTLRNQKPGKLSGGQKQRVALARTLASKPKLLLLDEPLSALDYEMRLNLQEEILKAHQMLNSASILVSHDPAEIRKMGTSVLELRNGAVVLKEEAKEKFVKPRFAILPAV